MGLGDFLSSLPIVGPVFGGLTGTAQAKAQEATAGYQANVSQAQIESEERMFNEQLTLDREKWDYLKTEATKPTGPLAQSGSYGYPYVAVKQVKAAPLVTMPVILVGGLLFYFVRKKR